MLTTPKPPLAVCLELTRAIGRTRTVEEIYDAALDALREGLNVSRASILLFDPDGVMRFKAYRHLSEGYRQAVEGHSPWTQQSQDPDPIVVNDVSVEPSLAEYLPAIRREGIAGMAFIPLVSDGRVIGKFMLYFAEPRFLSPDELQLSRLIASQVAVAVERTRSDEQTRRSEERLRFALDAALMGTWDWDLVANSVQWSANLERVHGLPAGTFDGSFSSYEREIHPDDRERVLASARRAITEGVPHEVEYRIVGPDGTIRWVEGKGRVEFRDGRPVRMTGVCMLVTRRKEAEAARLAAAEEASRLKDEFLATLSHELRTPLNAVLGWAGMLRSGVLPEARTRDAIEIIERNARLQSQLIEDILDISRIITGKVELDRAPISLAQVIEPLVTGALPSTQAKNLTVRCEIPGDLPFLHGDLKRLHQVFGNVLSNAVKFTPAGGAIDIRARARDGRLEITVQDSGVGIAPDFLPFVFDRFRQADSRSTRKHGGLGLGLAIARHLVEIHDGEIGAESAGIDQGTTITIRLPMALAALPETPSPHAAVDPPPDGVPLNGRTVVVVDDQPDSRQLLAALLEQSGGRVICCESAGDALDALESSGAELLVADLAMPDVDGFELIQRVRHRRSAFSAIPAVAVSAFARSEDQSRAIELGYNGYCTKPVDAELLLQALRQALAR